MKPTSEQAQFALDFLTRAESNPELYKWFGTRREVFQNIIGRPVTEAEDKAAMTPAGHSYNMLTLREAAMKVLIELLFPNRPAEGQVKKALEIVCCQFDCIGYSDVRLRWMEALKGRELTPSERDEAGRYPTAVIQEVENVLLKALGYEQ